MLKKILIFAITVFCLLSCAVSAAENDVQKARSFIAGIGCESVAKIDGGDAELTQREFVGYLTLALGVYPESEDLSNAELIKIEAAARNTGLLLRDYNPTAVITLNEAVKICMQAANYLQYELFVNGNDLGVYSEAYTQGIYRGIDRSKETVTADTALVLIRNLMDADYLCYVNDGTNTYKVETNKKTVLENYRGIHYIEGILNANSNTGLTDEDGAVGENKIKIDGVIYETEYNIDNFIGEKIRAYYTGNEYSGEIIVYAEESAKNNIVSVSCADVSKYEDYVLYYYEKNRTPLRRYKIDKSAAVLYNGVAYNSYTAEDFKQASGNLILIDNNNDGRYEVVKIEADRFMMVDALNKITKEIIQNGKSVLQLDKSGIKYSCYRLDRNDNLYEVELEDFVTDVPIRIRQSKNGKLIELYETDYVRGTVTGIENNTISIDGKQYPCIENFGKLYGVEMNYQGVFPLNCDGAVADYMPVSLNSDFMYAFLVSAYDSTDTEGKVFLKIYNQQGEIKRYTVSRKIRMDGKSVKPENICKNLITDNGNYEQIIRYRESKDNSVAEIDTAETFVDDGTTWGYPSAEDTANNLIKCTEGTFTFRNDYNIRCFVDENGSFNIAGNSAVFIVGTDSSAADDVRFQTGISGLSNGISRKLAAFNIDDGGCAGAVLIYTDTVSKYINVSVPSSIITDVAESVMPDGDIGYRVTYWKDNIYYTAYTSDINIKGNHKPLITGDVVRMELDSKGNISAIQVDVDYASMGPDSGGTSYFGNELAYISYTISSLYSYKNNYMLISNTKDDQGNYQYTPAKLGSYCANNAVIAVFDMQAKTVQKVDLSELRDYKTYGDDADELLIRKCYYAPMLAVAYRNREN